MLTNRGTVGTHPLVVPLNYFRSPALPLEEGSHSIFADLNFPASSFAVESPQLMFAPSRTLYSEKFPPDQNGELRSPHHSRLGVLREMMLIALTNSLENGSFPP